jgi:hypothetical protein
MVSSRSRIDERIDLSLAVPITNSLAFLFTVLGEWLAEGKSISNGRPPNLAEVFAYVL